MDYSHQSNVKRRRRQRSQLPRIQNKVGVLFFRTMIAVVLIGGFALMGLALGVYMGILGNSPTINITGLQPENYTSIIYSAKTGEEIDRLSGEENRVNADFERIPENLKNAFIAIEDERFYSHNGIDIRRIGGILYNLVKTKGEDIAGASTITQQLIKNSLGKSTNDLISKLQEQYLAIQFEKRLAEPDMLGSKQAAKDYILGMYMNIINLGRGYYGVQTAAWNYYGKDVSELTLAECATIAAITKNPTKYPPDIRQENNRDRMETVLEKMHDLNFITDKEYADALAEPVYDHIVQGIKQEDGSDFIHSTFTDTLINEVTRDLREKFQIPENEAFNWIYNKGLQIFSTQDLELQKIVDDAMMDDANFPEGDFEIDVEYRLSVKNDITGKTTNYNKKKTVKTWEEVDVFVQSVQDELLTSNDNVLADLAITTVQPQAAFVIIDYHTGQVKALSGGRGEKAVNRSFNRAIDATRSPGSQFKPLASYAPALDLGRITAGTVIDDAPYTYNDGVSTPYTPNNWYGKNTFEGLSTVRRGILHSMNILAVKNLIMNGIETSFAYMQNFGFTTLVEGEWRGNTWFTDKVPSLTLGGLTDGVRLTELCAAYGTIANEGMYNKPVYYTKVLDHDGNVLLENDPEPRQVLKKTTAYILTDMMKDTLRSGGTGVKAAFKEVNMPIAGKTGTSTDTKDLGFTGYTPYYVASIWMGFDQQKKINDTNDGHKTLWGKIMEEVHRGLPEKDFDRPDGIVTASVCKDSGMLGGDLCRRDPRGGRVYTEIYAAGTQPTEYCEAHQEIEICNTSGMRAGINCPAWEVEMRVGFVRTEQVDPDGPLPKDRAYEITLEMLEGPECTEHAFTGYYDPWGQPDDGITNIDGVDWILPESQESTDWWNSYTPPASDENTTPIETPEEYPEG